MKIDVNKYSDLDLALMVIGGYLGSGAERRIKLGSRYLKVQAIVNQIVRGKMPLPDSSGISKDQIRAAIEKVMPGPEDVSAFVDSIMEEI